MAKKKDEREQFITLREAYGAAHQAAQDESIRQSVRYGSEQNARSWASKGDKSRLEKLYAKQNKLGDSIVGLIAKVSPRGDAWRSGVPAHHLQGKLTWEDVVRPKTEPLSALPPPAWGWSEADVRRHLHGDVVLPPGTEKG
jgi:hypothetical protein